MFCTNCGAKINDNARFCGMCGVKITSAKPASSKASLFQRNKSNQYSVYEKFNALNLVITDRSIILKGQEYRFDQLTVIAPEKEITAEFIGPGYIYRISTTINGKEHIFSCPKKLKPRFCFAAVKANERIKITSKRDKLKYACMIFMFLSEANKVIKRLPVTIGDKKYETFKIYNEKIIINPGARLREADRQLISNYTYAQIILNEFFQTDDMKNFPVTNRHPLTVSRLAVFMSDSDDDWRDVILIYNKYNQILRYNQKIKEDKERAEQAYREWDDSGEYNSSHSSSVMGDVLKTAAGVAIGNKISKHSDKKKKRELTWHYTCSISCPRYTKGYGPTRCRLDPSTCGHGLKY